MEMFGWNCRSHAFNSMTEVSVGPAPGITDSIQQSHTLPKLPQHKASGRRLPKGHTVCFMLVLTWRSRHGVRLSTVHVLTAPAPQPSAGVAPRCDPSGDTVMGMMHDLCGPPTCGDVLSTASRRSVACLAGRQAMPLMMRPAPGQAGNRAALGAAADGA